MSKLLCLLLVVISASASASVELRVYEKFGKVIATEFNAASLCSGKGYDRDKTTIVKTFKYEDRFPTNAVSIVHPNGDLGDKVIVRGNDGVNILNVIHCSL